MSPSPSMILRSSIVSFVPHSGSYTARRRPSLSPLRLDSITEIPEYSLNLGTESPLSISNAESDQETDAVERSQVARDEWVRAGIFAHTDVPMRKRCWRPSSFPERRKGRDRRELADRDCGICFELAVMPCRTLCCGKLFCLEHLADWLHGSSSNGLCPSCETPCELETDILSLASPASISSAHHRIMRRHTQPAISMPDRPPLRLLKQTPTSSRPTTPPSSYHSSTSASISSSEQRVPTVRSDFQSLVFGPFVLSWTTLEMLSRIAGKALTVVGLTLFLYVLLT